MSSLGQTMLMALTVTVNKYASSNIQAVHNKKQSNSTLSSSSTNVGFGRRGVVLSAVSVIAATQDPESRTLLLQKYLKKTEENKEKNNKERTDSYYKRNYKDYFEFIEGSLRAKEDGKLSEAEKGILEWLEANK